MTYWFITARIYLSIFVYGHAFLVCRHKFIRMTSSSQVDQYTLMKDNYPLKIHLYMNRDVPSKL